MAEIRITRELMEWMLDLPEGMSIIGASYDHPAYLSFYVKGEFTNDEGDTEVLEDDALLDLVYEQDDKGRVHLVGINEYLPSPEA